MQEIINTLIKEVKAYQGHNTEDMTAFRQKFVHRKGLLAELFKKLKEVPPAARQEIGKQLNELKKLVEEKDRAFCAHANPDYKKPSKVGEQDLTLPPMSGMVGSLHPLRMMEKKIVSAFQHIGFEVKQGPEIEDDWHNFTALNIPPDHPARDMHDTFFIGKRKKWMLRTHTSNIQIRTMSAQKPPYRVIAPGRVFRNETISARSHCMFHQIEGFFVDKKVSMADLKGTLYYFIRTLFGKERQLRLRPSFFPFTSPSVEVDMSCTLCAGKGCSVCKRTGWVEVLGAGMIDPHVLQACKIDSTKYNGFAFGMGIERLTMLYHQINDVRLFTQNDVRFLKQFATFQ